MSKSLFAQHQDSDLSRHHQLSPHLTFAHERECCRTDDSPSSSIEDEWPAASSFKFGHEKGRSMFFQDSASSLFDDPVENGAASGTIEHILGAADGPDGGAPPEAGNGGSVGSPASEDGKDFQTGDTMDDISSFLSKLKLERLVSDVLIGLHAR